MHIVGDPTDASGNLPSSMATVEDQSRLDLDRPLGTGPEPFSAQLLKWVGNKQRFAGLICEVLPPLGGNRYFEPFLGTGAVLATLRPSSATGSDVFGPLVEIWQTLASDPALLLRWYEDRYARYVAGDRVEVYNAIRASYNADPNGADLLFLSRSCYGGVVRFRRADGYMSTPCGPHRPIAPSTFARRVVDWHERTRGATFRQADFAESFAEARAGDVIYCDPPYTDTQSILYGAQAFRLERLLKVIGDAKERGVRVALSLDGTKKNGLRVCASDIPEGLFERELVVDVGGSMLRRIQGVKMEHEQVADRLLLTY